MISEAELQEDVERFTGRFFDRLAQELEPSRLLQASPQHQQALLKHVLIYSASALDIASGRSPAVNMLDMVVFVSLSRDAFERYWQPVVFGLDGRRILEVLRTSEADIWQLSSKVLTEQQQANLVELIEQWKLEHPDQVRIAATRLPALSQLASREAGRNKASGMLAAVKSATRVGDEAVLLGERALFVGQRMPFLLRLQTRVAANEVMTDGGTFLVSQEALLGHTERLLARTEQLVLQSSQLVARTGQLGPILGDAKELTRNVETLAREAQLLERSLDALATRFEPLLAPRADAEGRTTTGLESALARSNELSQNTLAALREARALMPTGAHDERWLLLQAQLDRTARRWLAYLALVGAVWALFFWGGYYLVRRHPAAPLRRTRSPRPRHFHSSAE